ncbi:MULTISPECIES: hypothetical protein [Companilactobacillus]|nr:MULTISPECIES: hypothetical protein [Companilactobacillus]
MTPSNDIFPISNSNDVFDIADTEGMYSQYDDKPNITKELLVHLLQGDPVVDLSDGEYIHWLQLDSGALKYLRSNNIIS